MSGQIFMDAVAQTGAQLLPLDSEHNAVFQCLPNQAFEKLRDIGVACIHLTASGGPFLKTPLNALEQVSPEQACSHPKWVMGRKISVDSATMMNKGLEIIEASWLFHASKHEINVLIHPQSIVHSMVEYVDGSFLAQLGNPDMRTPIAHALAWPERIESGVKPLNLLEVENLQFSAPDLHRFPCLGLAQQVLERGGTSSTILNAANEVAVAAFLEKQIKYTDIPGIIEKTLTEMTAVPADNLEVIIQQDLLARQTASGLLAKYFVIDKKRYGSNLN
jgi:1-deoxy-D-xylulose-5-phosphate reductoisomerase